MGYLYLLLALSLAISSLGWVRIVDAKIVKSASIENKEARDLLDAERYALSIVCHAGNLQGITRVKSLAWEPNL